MKESSKITNIQIAVLIGTKNSKQKDWQVKESLDELAFLAQTAGACPIKRFIQRLITPSPSTYIREGKIQEIAHFVKTNSVDLVIFDDELTPSQMRNIERDIGTRVMDRTHLILDIFAKRAKTAHAKIQVELAQYQYLLPRLAHMWTHLERQKGGIGLRGPGEREIETDRRLIRDRITKLKKILKKIDRQKSTQRKHRGKLVRVALIGYTNTGKSTLMNLLSKSNILAENKLFATLDTTVRKITIKNLPFLITDTVGFIRKLPYTLIESFKSTLDEVREADILLHIVDISHPNFEEQINIVNQTLPEIGANNKPVFLVFNKIDLYNNTFKLANKPIDYCNLDEIKKIWIARENQPSIFISAKYKQNIDELKDILYEKVKEIHIQRYPYNDFLY